MPVKKEELLPRLNNVTPIGSGKYKSDCPSHESQSKLALSITEVDAEHVITHCFAGCLFEDVLAAVGLSTNGSKTKPKTFKTEDLPQGIYYGFETLRGNIAYMQRHKGAYYRPIGEDLWIANLDGVTPVLYNLPGLIRTATAGDTVFHTEGCKDVENLKEHFELEATTSGGVKSWRSGFRYQYAGADVVILPDNDAEGLAYAATVAAELYGVANSVKIVSLPDLPDKGDVSDWIEAGHTREDLFELVDSTPVYTPEVEAPWSTPQSLDVGLPPVEELNEALLPETVCGWVFDTARRMDNAAPDFAAAASVVVAGALIGRKVGLRPKRYDDWTVIPNLWGGLIGLPASMKTPALEQIVKPLKRLGAESYETHREELESHELEKMVAEAEKAALQASLKDTAKEIAKGKANRTALADIKKKLEKFEEPEPPVEKRYSTNDSTIERLAEILQDNPNGILNYRDELMGWLRNLDKIGRETDRAFFLEAWNGNQAFDSDRIGRGRIYVPAVCVSILGGIQPGPLTTYVRDAVEDSEKADGLLQRFQIMVWPDTPAYEQIDQWPDTEAKNKAYAALKALSELDSEKFGAIHDEDEDVPYLRFSPEAQEIFNSWRDEFEPKYRGGTVPPALESHFMKYRSLFASLALVFEALEFVSGKSEGGSVGERSALRAAAWCEYLESHAIRLYNPLLSAPMYAAQDLLEHIDAGDVPHKSKVRDVWHKNWSGLDTPDAIREALQVLEEHGWVRVKKIKPAGGGRPAEQIYLHPDLRGTEA